MERDAKGDGYKNLDLTGFIALGWQSRPKWMKTGQLWTQSDTVQRWRKQAFVWHGLAVEQKILRFIARVSGGKYWDVLSSPHTDELMEQLFHFWSSMTCEFKGRNRKKSRAEERKRHDTIFTVGQNQMTQLLVIMDINPFKSVHTESIMPSNCSPLSQKQWMIYTIFLSFIL